MLCNAIVTSKCPKNHNIKRKCHDKAAETCRKCDAEARAQEKRRQRDYKLDQERQAKQQAYASRLAEIEDEIEHQKRVLKNQNDENERDQVLAQKTQDLLNLKTKAQANKDQNLKNPMADNSSTTPVPPAQSDSTSSKNGPAKLQNPVVSSEADTSGDCVTSIDPNGSLPDSGKSGAKDEWQWQKQYEGAVNESLDALVSMIGR